MQLWRCKTHRTKTQTNHSRCKAAPTAQLNSHPRSRPLTTSRASSCSQSASNSPHKASPNHPSVPKSLSATSRASTITPLIIWLQNHRKIDSTNSPIITRPLLTPFPPKSLTHTNLWPKSPFSTLSKSTHSTLKSSKLLNLNSRKSQTPNWRKSMASLTATSSKKSKSKCEHAGFTWL